jgi:hypothetical protein
LWTLGVKLRESLRFPCAAISAVIILFFSSFYAFFAKMQKTHPVRGIYLSSHIVDKDRQIVADTTRRWRQIRALAVLGLLTAVYTIGYIDRQVLNLLVQPIKQSFNLTDVQISLLQGLGFSGGYLLFSPVFSRWVDVGNRRNVMAYATGAWSLSTALAGAVRGYYGLLAARFGLGCAKTAMHQRVGH